MNLVAVGIGVWMIIGGIGLAVYAAHQADIIGFWRVEDPQWYQSWIYWEVGGLVLAALGGGVAIYGLISSKQMKKKKGV